MPHHPHRTEHPVAGETVTKISKISKVSFALHRRLQAIPWTKDENRPGFRYRKLALSDDISIEDRDSGCGDCEASDPVPFIVKPHLWREFGNGGGFLCIPCFEKRMGRRLAVDDLWDTALMNALALHIAGHDVPLSVTAKLRKP